MKNIKLILVSLFLLIPIISMSQIRLKTTKLSIFKNGTYFLLQEGNPTIKNRQFTLLAPTQALYGTYWMSVGKDQKIQSMAVKSDTVKTKREAENWYDLLDGNKNKQTTIYFTSDNKNNMMREVRGQILKLYRTQNIIKLKNGDKISLVSLNNILQVDIDGANEKTEIDSIARVVNVTLDKNVETASVSLLYMQTGMAWTPSYALKLLDDKNAKLEMKAIVENYSEAVENCELDLVVGNPQMYYGMQLDPITMDYLSGIVNAYKEQNYYQYQMNAAPAMPGNAVEDMSLRAVPVFNGSEYNTEGNKENDLYYYHLGKVNLQKNTKTILPISTSAITYKDLYEVDVYDYTNYFNNRACYPDPNRKFETYHTIKFDNTTAAPLTTASIFVVNENEDPLAQDQVKYTPLRAETTVRLSKAIDIVVKGEEEENGRTDNYKKINKVNYSKVIIKGTVEIANYQNKKIKLTVKKGVNGEVTSQSDNGKTKKQVQNYHAYVNPFTQIEWELEMIPNEKKSLKYEYEVLVNLGY